MRIIPKLITVSLLTAVSTPAWAQDAAPMPPPETEAIPSEAPMPVPMFGMTAAQRAEYDTWQPPQRAQYANWPGDVQAYFWSLPQPRQQIFFRLSDEDRMAVTAMTTEDRAAAWEMVETRIAQQASALATTPAPGGDGQQMEEEESNPE